MEIFQYNQQRPAFAGMKADSRDDTVETYCAGEDIPFGVFVHIKDGKVFIGDERDENPKNLLGIAIHSHGVIHADFNGYKKGDPVSVMTIGAAWVKATNLVLSSSYTGLSTFFVENGRVSNYTAATSTGTGGSYNFRIVDTCTDTEPLALVVLNGNIVQVPK